MKRTGIILFGLCLFFFCSYALSFCHTVKTTDFEEEVNLYSFFWDPSADSVLKDLWDYLKESFFWLLMVIALIITAIRYYITKITKFIKRKKKSDN
ncbi:MAG: hypothetical protein IJK41_05895 [Muribaculaceae bacterium]|nr:hypothetical protein [Muribaculaceae bacterium]